MNENRTKEEAKESSRQKTRERLTQYKKPPQPPQKTLAKKRPEAKKSVELKPEEMAKIEPIKEKETSKPDAKIRQKNGSVVSELNETMPKVSTSPVLGNQPVQVSLGRISSSDIIVHAAENLFEESLSQRHRPISSHSKHAAFRSKIVPVLEDVNGNTPV